MKQCIKCSNEGKITVQANSYCPRCFAAITVRRISKTLRQTHAVKKDSNVLVLGKITQHIFRLVIKSIPINITFMELKSFNIDYMNDDILTNKEILDYAKKNSVDAIIIPWTLENELRLNWNEMIGEKRDSSDVPEPNNSEKNNSEDLFIKLFLPILDYELDELARYYDIAIDDIRSEKESDKDLDIKKLFDEFENRYLGAKFGFYKSLKELRELE